MVDATAATAAAGPRGYAFFERLAAMLANADEPDFVFSVFPAQ
jgi:hypothetical protein